MNKIDTSTEAVEMLLDGVTPGPWRIKDCESAGYRCANYHQEIWNEDTDILVTTEVTRAHNDGGAKNMRFICAARDLVPALLAERDAQAARADAAEARAASLRRDIWQAMQDAREAAMREADEATDPDFIWGALDNVHDAETTLDDYAAAISRAQRAALAASRAASDCQQQGLVTAELHRSFHDAGDGRPMPPMGDDLITAGLSADDARFVAVQLAQNGLMLVASQPAQPAAVKVKPLAWTKSGAATQFGNYIVTCEDHDDRTVWFVLFGGKVLSTCGEHDSEASAKAAAQAAYEARIFAALDAQPITVQDAARVLLDAQEKLKGKSLYEMTEAEADIAVLPSLRAIAEGRA